MHGFVNLKLNIFSSKINRMGILDTRYVYRSPTKHIGTNPPGTQIPNKMCRYYTAVGTYQKVSRDKPDPGAPRP